MAKFNAPKHFSGIVDGICFVKGKPVSRQAFIAYSIEADAELQKALGTKLSAKERKQRNDQLTVWIDGMIGEQATASSAVTVAQPVSKGIVLKHSNHTVHDTFTPGMTGIYRGRHYVNGRKVSQKELLAATKQPVQVPAEKVQATAKKAVKKAVSSKERVSQLAAAREAYFKRMGFGKYAKKTAKAKAAPAPKKATKTLSKKERNANLAAAREAYFKKMGFGKYAKKSSKKSA